MESFITYETSMAAIPASENVTMPERTLISCSNNDSGYTTANCTEQQSYTITPLVTPLYIKLYVGLLNGIIFSLGVSGNIFVIFIVLSVKEMRTHTNFCLINLSFTDLIYLLVCQPAAVLDFYQEEKWTLGEFMCRFVYFLENLSTSTTILTIIAISLERYFAICHPLLNYSMFSGSRVTKVILAIWLLAALVCFPFLLTSELKESSFHDGSEGYICINDIHLIWQHIYLWVILLLFFILPLFLLIILYLRIICTLLSQTLQGAADTRKNCASMKSRKQVVYILATVVTMFFLCLVPLRILILWKIYAPYEQHKSLPFVSYLNILHTVRLLTYFNSACNPIIYNLISTKFRAASMSVLRRCRSRDQYMSSNTNRLGRIGKKGLCGTNQDKACGGCAKGGHRIGGGEIGGGAGGVGGTSVGQGSGSITTGLTASSTIAYQGGCHYHYTEDSNSFYDTERSKMSSTIL
ncbi:growth hormone secretagogue receptor type 1 [Octopus bimaculoides]|uniref:G-protein coupled receptors family 1 profile domain-containing protein n=1 Tax=Octopus bimaculoides TaxID=37653 RepID=A0A0L8GIC9_OCTBM|nr:growth hormone secretagogue receptor type 1 [Octopus bimaculoides]|eukprot:XP_014780730.1 PREDICTED: growth hormone secretagogue receptor type 1-like [Octopus bimaculoides]